MGDYLKEIISTTFLHIFFYNSWKKKKTSAFKITSLKQEKRINARHKGTLFLLQVSESTTRDPMQGDIVFGLF
jgi:hypothetical protein